MLKLFRTASVEGGAALERYSFDRWAVLAGLRFLLSMIVFIGHMATALPHWFVLAHLNGYAAIFGFFAISGYSISSSLERAPQGYADRRFWRIYPVYLVSLVTACVPFALFGPLFTGFAGPVQGPSTIWPFLGNALMLQCVAVFPLFTDSPMWSLGAECTYYALAPTFRRLGTRTLLCLFGVSLGLCIAATLRHPLIMATIRFGLPALLLLWAWLAGFIYNRCESRPWASYLLWVPGLCLLPLDGFMSGQFGCLTIMGAALGLQYACRIPLSEQAARVWTYFGELSYPVYLLHMPVALLTYHFLTHGQPANPADWWRQFPVVFVCVLGAAVAVYHGVDKPCRAYARRRYGPAAKPLAQASA